MSKLVIVILALAIASPAMAATPEAPAPQPVLLHVTDIVTASAHLIFKATADGPSMEGSVLVVEHGPTPAPTEPLTPSCDRAAAKAPSTSPRSDGADADRRADPSTACS
jgi:hypothetical protein